MILLLKLLHQEKQKRLNSYAEYTDQMIVGLFFMKYTHEVSGRLVELRPRVSRPVKFVIFSLLFHRK